MLIASHETTKRAQEVVATSAGALRTDPSGSRYQDLGQVIDATNVAAGAIVYMDNYVTGLEWVRNMVFFVTCDQTHEVRSHSKNTAGQEATLSFGIATSLGSTSPINAGAPRISGQNALCGYAAKFGVKNAGASPATVVKMWVQLQGL